jgi:hypothetical protein
MVVFDNSENDNKKKYVCFVCVQEFPSYESYRYHIIENHAENEEYVLCPRCQAPCRDLKSHWRVKHKDAPLPELPRYRSEKWNDWDYQYQKLKQKKRKWKDGNFDSIKMGKQIHYRSSWERDVMICLEKCVDVTEYYGDNHICIPYMIHGVKRKYWPDFTIKMKNGDIFILEIKPEDQTEWTINQMKWKYAIEYCEKRQWNFQVWTQKYIRKIKARAVRSDVLLSEHLIPSDEDMEELKIESR